MLQFLLVVTNY